MTDYYCDATGGLDSNSGLTTLLPWQTRTRVATGPLSPADTVYCKRNEVWQEVQNVNASGTSGNPITYDAYGSGPAPVLSAADKITGWTLDSVVAGGERYWANWTTPAPAYAWIDYGLDVSQTVSINQGSLAAADQVGEHFWDSATSKVYLVMPTGQVPGSGNTIWGSRRSNNILASVARNYITLKNHTLRFTSAASGAFAAQALVGPSNGWVFQDVVQEWGCNGFKISGGSIAQNTTISFIRVTSRYNREHGFQPEFHNNALMDTCMADRNGRQGFGLVWKSSTIRYCTGRYSANKAAMWPSLPAAQGFDANFYIVGSELTFEPGGFNLIYRCISDHGAKANFATDSLSDSNTFLRCISYSGDLYAYFFEGGTLSGCKDNRLINCTGWGCQKAAFQSQNGHGAFTALNNIFFNCGLDGSQSACFWQHEIRYSGNWTLHTGSIYKRDHVRWAMSAVSLPANNSPLLTAAASVGAMTAGSWFYDPATETLYVWKSDSSVVASTGVWCTPTTPIVSDYNIWPTSGLIFTWKYAGSPGTGYSGATARANVFAAFGLEQHSVQSNPLLIDPANGNFKIPSNSPARDVGTVVADVIQEWVGPSPDIGAEEYHTPPTLSTQARDTQLNALASHFNSAYLRIYSGTQPATPDTAASGTLLAELRFNSTAFPTVSGGGPLTANAITDDAAADNTGTAAWFRIVEADGTTPILDGSVGTSGANLNFATVAFTAGTPIRVTSYTHTLPISPS
jgi:hypothetical protein